MDLALKYDRAAPSWDRKISRLGYHVAYAGFLRGRVTAVGRVLDVGAGTGAFALAWIAEGGSADLTLLDCSPAMLATARAGLEARGVMADLAFARLEDFDPGIRYAAILAAHAIEHCADPAWAVGRLASWLQPGGHLYLAVSRPHWCNWLIWLRFRHRWFSSGQVRAMARAAGLRHRHTCAFDRGPPSRTSLAYVFVRP